MMKKTKQITAVILSFMLVVSTVLGQLPASTRASASGYGISNPRTDSSGVTTWDCILFGNYWQSSETTKEPIKWRVLSVNGDDAFLLADQNLDCQPYNTEYTSVTWETCTLRTWLNSTFYQNAFSGAEQAAVRTTAVVNKDNPEYGTEGGNNTQDKVYLLSIAEASNAAYGFNSTFDESNETRCAKNTEYAKKQGAYTNTNNSYAGNGQWWLRSPGNFAEDAALVYSIGYGLDVGRGVNLDDHAVRPALHINLSSSTWSKAGTVSSSGGSTGGATPAPSPSTGSSGLTCKPDLTVEVGNTGTVNARVYAETKEDMKALSSDVSWSSSDPSVAEVKSGGFIHATSPASYSGTDGSYSLWYASGLVTVTGKKEGTAVITGKLNDGTSVRCDVTVENPAKADSSSGEGNGGSLEIGENKESNADDGNKGVAQFFPANWSLSSTKYPVQISQKENKDGSFILKASIGIGKSDLLDPDKNVEWSKFKKNCEMASKNQHQYAIMESCRETYGLKSSTAIHSSGWSGKKKPSLSVMGYVEVKSDKYGNIMASEGKIAGDLSWKGDISWQFATPIGPMYLKLGAEGTASLEGGPSWNNKEKKMSLDGKFSITPAISLTGGYGIDKIASISATGKASVGVQAYPPSKGTFTAEASVNVYALFVINHTWTLAKFTKEMWNTTNKKKSMSKKNGLGLPEEELSFIDTSFSKEDKGWTGRQKARSRQQDKRTLKEGLLPSSLPMLARLGEKQVMVWQDYDAARDVADSSVLMYSVYENGVWSEPQAVCDDGYGDACADLQVVDGTVHLTWQKQKVNVSTEDADAALSSMAEKAEVYYAQFDSAGNTFTHVTQVTDNTACDMTPKFVRGADTVRIAWVRNDAGSMLQSEGTNTIYTAAWDGTGFGSEQLLAESPGTIERYVPYVQDGAAKAVYVTKANDIMAVQSSDNILPEELAELMSMAEDGTISVADYAEGEIRFIQNGILYCYDPATGKVASCTAGSSAFDGTAVYCSNGTKSGYIWSAYEEETGTGKIMASLSTDGGYSEPVTVYETEGEVSRHIAPVLTEDGEWNVALNQENVQDGIHSLSWLRREEKEDTTLVAAYVDEDDVKDGLTGVDYVFTNTGDTVVDQITIQVTLADGTEIEKQVSCTVNPGETVSETAYINLSGVDRGQDIRISLYASGQAPDSGDMVSDVIEQGNISLVGTATEQEGKITVTAYAKNQGNRTVDTKISLYGDADKKELLDRQEGITIPAGQTKPITFTVDPKQVQYNENDAAYLTLSADVEGGDYDLADNTAYLALYKGEKVDANTEGKDSSDPVVKPTPIPKPSQTPAPAQEPNTTTAPDMPQQGEVKVTPPPAGSKVKDKTGAVYTITRSGTSRGEAAYTAPKNKRVTSISVPATVKLKGITYKVTSIKASACKNCKKLKKATIGKNIKTIGKNAFYGCGKLKNIVVKTTKLTKKNVGSKAFSKLHKKLKLKVPKKKLKIYKKIFREKGVTGKKQLIKK